MSDEHQKKVEEPRPEGARITPEVVKQLAEESRRLRQDYRRRIVRMWNVSADERQARSR